MFHKKKPMSLVSHHDIVRIFERSFRRAGLSLEFSKGFNPQPKLSFAQPLPLGVEGEREYGEFLLADGAKNNENDLDNENNLDSMIEMINKNLTDGLKILDLKKIETSSVPKLMSIIDASLYEMDLVEVLTLENLEKTINEIIDSDELKIITQKKDKKGKKTKQKEKDIKPLIFKLQIQNHSLEALIKTGSRGNLRPDELARAILEKSSEYNSNNLEEIIHSIKFVRKELYYDQNLKEKEIDEVSLKPIWEYDLGKSIT